MLYVPTYSASRCSTAQTEPMRCRNQAPRRLFSSFCIPPYYFTLQAVIVGRFSLILLRTALTAAQRSAGTAARHWATVAAAMFATITR